MQRKWPLFQPREPQQPRATSIFFQILLFCNVTLSVFFFCIVGSSLRWKYWFLPSTTFTILWQIFYCVGLGLWIIAEPPRLYLGYEGNLREDSRHLVAFLVLTFLPQLPVTIGMFVQPQMYSAERVMAGSMISFLFVEFVTAIVVARRVVAANTQRWRIKMAYGRSSRTAT
ncbi:hypothetical protein PAPYR_1234 [Paratrimastix pyriformis]|uniref:Transmembrane protein n=1 Tax=Paratrimastix pyriformis TaxID=342808 RepID=A0ABQ8UXG1_9EUKA|nr:hypothetical protein PAPYR_1234 [Paratrimastix pyriformis]